MSNKEKIIKIVSKNSCGMNAKNILEKIWNIDKTTVYRNLEKLVISWEFIEDFSSNWEKRYSIKNNHHHHFICDNCSKKINIWCFLDEKIKELEENFNISINNHSFLLSWLCEGCKIEFEQFSKDENASLMNKWGKTINKIFNSIDKQLWK